MVYWKVGVDPEGSHGMLEGRGGSRGFTMVCWNAGADPEGLPWYAGRSGWIQGGFHAMLEGIHTSCVDIDKVASFSVPLFPTSAHTHDLNNILTL